MELRHTSTDRTGTYLLPRSWTYQDAEAHCLATGSELGHAYQDADGSLLPYSWSA